MLTDKQVEQHLKEITAKAKMFDFAVPWLNKNLTQKQLDELSIIMDPLSRRILAYLASDEK